ncbi:MAG: GTP pyrophosphokinase family protein [Defluviitaleaceae bacterium]|nr:GTP pyrophosphokinase family protein [Defluviitaleaceae bacterium]
MAVKFCELEFERLKKLLLSYEWAHRTMLTKLSIIHDALKVERGAANPIGSIAGRIKAPESIAGKLHKLNFELTAESARKNLFDIAGIRIICSYARDIYYLAGLIREMPGINVTTEKDYVTNPKKSGYRSYHMIIEVGIYHSGNIETLPVEIQLRTEAMNFWATLEHQVKYKYKDEIPKHLSDELISCADQIAVLDNRMFVIQDIVSLINGDNEKSTDI